MKKFEHLFSQDPIGAFEKIEEDYARYFKRAYNIDNKKLDDERMDTLLKDENLSKKPYIEILPEYSPIEGIATMEKLIDRFSKPFGNREYSKLYFEEFIAKGLMRGLMKEFTPYGHQIGMLEKAFAGLDENGQPLKYKNTIITSGTGSGKTESFLLPLLADIFKEAIGQNWNTANNHTNWHEGILEGSSTTKKYNPNQRTGDPRPAGLRALILYPMNALVEDQMARLREALDSNDVRNFMDEKLGGNRIYFGSYNGSTIAPKSWDLLETGPKRTFNKKREEVAEQLQDIYNHFTSICTYVNDKPEKKDALYIAPRLGGTSHTSEMITRWDMQKWAPDILITNTSMLSIMLMRKAEEQIFADTKKWLAAEDLPESEREEAKKERIFHIVVDELHLYRGTAGSEIACLLRMLYHAIGLEPVVDNGYGHKIPNPQIKILASSASLGDNTQKFLEEFFGIYSTIESEVVFNIQTGSNYIGNSLGKTLDYTKFEEFNHENFIAIELENKSETVAKERLLMCTDFIKDTFNCDSLDNFCKQYEEQIFSDFYSKLPCNTDGSKRPIALDHLINELFDGNKKALRGFLIFRGYIDSQVKRHKLPRFRFHKFFKYVEGLWGQLNPTLSEETPPVINLSYTPKEVGAKKMLELLRCENCGQLFIGGNRKINAIDNSISLTLNSPNLEQIPNFNPTPMVQNKTYSEYAIFWPHDIKTKIDIDKADHVVEISTGDFKYALGRACWIPGYLDSQTGEFIKLDNSITLEGKLKKNIQLNGIQGFLYKVNQDNSSNEIDDNQASKIYAAPCTCPHCLQDYTTRKYTNSPIRSFRTGIDRSNQILSKELLYQLDEKSAKLIGFSDSREDAAKQALGIEKEHYRDMVRMLFVECVEEFGKDIDDIETFVNLKIQESQGDINKMFEIPNETSKRFSFVTNVTEIATAILTKKDLSIYRTTSVPLENFIGKNLDGKLVRKLLQKGINPAGEAHKYQWYNKANVNGLFHWSTAFDFTNYCLRPNPDFKDTTYSTQIRKQLENAVFANSFGKYMGVSVLDAGIGYISGPKSDAIIQSEEYKEFRKLLPKEIDVYEFVDAFIRVMGDNYLYPNNDDYTNGSALDYNNLKAIVKKPLRHLYKQNKEDETLLGNALCNYLKKYCTNGVSLVLDLSKLSFKQMTKDKYLKCPKCGRVHPNMGFGFCTNTNCMEKLDPSVFVHTDDLHNHYISFDILKEKKTAKKLHTEELSGQTDNIQERLREFKDLILTNNNDPYKIGFEITKPIDMVCVTTTMEVGVDIGSLQAIFQGNMPPTRYNYQQRVGRGGRRGQAYSTAVTFCRGRSHDVYYYEKATDEMVGGIPATPKLSLAPYRDTDGNMRMKIAIMKRVIVKEILHQAFLSLDYQPDLIDTAGEFGFVGEWEETSKQILTTWIQHNSITINDIVHRYFDQFNIKNEINNDIEDIIDWISKDMVSQIDRVVKKTTNYDMGLASYLSETGFLPMYGMPSDARNFYHGFDTTSMKVKSIDRSTEMAISEFAPGSEKTKDKGKYRVEGLTVPIKEDLDYNGRISFFDPNADALSDSYVLTYSKKIGESDNNIKDIDEILLSQSPTDIALEENQRLIVIPQAYRSLKIRGNTGIPVENNDRGSSFAQSIIFAKDNNNSSNKKKVENVCISMYEMGLNEDPTVWHINSNNNRFYKGNYEAIGLGVPTGGKTNFLFFDNTQDGINRIKDGFDIALGSKKTTEMVKLELQSYPEVLDLNLSTGNKSAIRAAFYSAAFLLQRALADKLDVQPDEIEICEKIDEQSGYPSLYLSDSLPNGAGIVSYLYGDGKLEELIKSIINFDSFDPTKTSRDKSFMQYLISDDHRQNCMTACQKCLLTYTNRGFHHILDWRLGIGLLRLMLDKTYDFGFDVNKRLNYKELSDWNHIIHECAKKFNLEVKYQDQNPSYCNKHGNCTIFYHPLWNKTKVVNNINEEYDSIELFNTFKVLRSDLSLDEFNGRKKTPREQSLKAKMKRKKKTQQSESESIISSDNNNEDEIIPL